MHPLEHSLVCIADSARRLADQIPDIPDKIPADFAPAVEKTDEFYPWRATHGDLVGIGKTRESAIRAVFERYWFEVHWPFNLFGEM